MNPQPLPTPAAPEPVRPAAPPPCPFDPRPLRGLPLGQFHCPRCGQMVLAGLPHHPGQGLGGPPLDDALPNAAPPPPDAPRLL